MGEWNRMKIKVVGDKVTTWLNGTQMITLEDENWPRKRIDSPTNSRRWRNQSEVEKLGDQTPLKE